MAGEIIWIAKYQNIKRNWKDYSVNHLINELAIKLINYVHHDNSVQCQWNFLEGVIISAIDKIVPLCNFNRKLINKAVSPAIKCKINKRKRLLKIDKQRASGNHTPEIKILNAEINLYFANLKREKVRKTTMGVS